MTEGLAQIASPAEITLAYHARTKHRLKRYAAGPEALDWDLQPNPFREFEGCPRIPLAPTAVTSPACARPQGQGLQEKER